MYSLHRLGGGGGGGVGEHRQGAYVPPSDDIHAKECVWEQFLLSIKTVQCQQ